MKVKLSKLWQHLGTEVHITEEIADEHCPMGFYNIIEKGHDECYMFLNSAGSELFYLEEWDDEMEINITSSDIEDRVEALVNAYSIQIIGLIADGWTEGGHMDLTPYHDTLKEYKKLLNIIKEEEKENGIRI